MTVSYSVVVPMVDTATSWRNIGYVTYSNNPDNGPDEPDRIPSNEVEIEEKPEKTDTPTSPPNPEPEDKVTSTPVKPVEKEPAKAQKLSEPEKVSSPKTGDDLKIGLWVSLFVMALCGIGILDFIAYRKRNDDKN